MERDTPWSFVLVEDNETVRREVLEYIGEEEFDFGRVDILPLASFDEALPLLVQRKVDLVILDVMGDPEQNKTAGIRVLERWKETGFSPVIFYTALPELVEEYQNPLVKVVAKDAGLFRLRQAIIEFFDLKIPQTHRAIAWHFDSALRDYMWGFVLDNWTKLQDLVDRPDFVRLLLRRLAAQFSREGVEKVVEALYPGTATDASAGHLAHPTEYYIKPSIGPDPKLGDIRKISGKLCVIVWPSCDLVMRGDTCKVERILCARALPIGEFKEFGEWSAERENPRKWKALEALMRNNRGIGQSERYHFLPAAWDIPASVIDFQDLRDEVALEVRAAECIATVASPFAESISARFMRYLGRLGTPDLDIEASMRSMEQR